MKPEDEARGREGAAGGAWGAWGGGVAVEADEVAGQCRQSEPVHPVCVGLASLLPGTRTPRPVPRVWCNRERRLWWRKIRRGR